MTYTGIVKGNTIEIDEEMAIPDGTRVRVIPEDRVAASSESGLTLREWVADARKFRATLPVTGDSVAILKRIRKDRANR